MEPSTQDRPPIARDRLKEYVSREAENPHLGSFDGGGPPNSLWIGVGLLCVLIIAIYTIFIEPGRNRL